MQSTNIIMPTNFHILQIQHTLMGFPPNVGPYGFPYTLEDITSKCVKLAANPSPEEVKYGFDEIKANITVFGQEYVNQLMEHLRLFVQFLVQTFRRFGWYSADGSSPFRFVGFTDGSFDIEVRSG